MRMRAATEVVIGVLYAIGAVHQTLSVLPNSKAFYIDMAEQAWLPPAQSFIEGLLIPNSVIVTVLVIILEATLAIAILTRRSAVHSALIAGGVFSIIGALTGAPVETVGYGILAAIHFWLAAGH